VVDDVKMPVGQTEVRRIDLWKLRVPLTTPYRLAFGDQTAFDCVLVRLELSGGSAGFGEAALLPGYSDETVDASWSLARTLAREHAPGPADRMLAALNAKAKTAAFTASAFQTAFDQAKGHPALTTVARVPLLGTVNAKPDETDALERHIDDLITAGYTTLKVKVGWDLETDLAAVKRIQAHVSGRAKLRIDGNQGFTRADGVAFAARVDPTDVELLEQPCAADDWDAAVAVKTTAGVPIMLDEAIYGEHDIRRAAGLGCADYIKLKLMKMGSIDRLIAGLRLIRELGMRPVLGNGVATDLGCWMEACVAAGEIDNAGEMNGFLKPTTSLFVDPLRMEGADLILDRSTPKIDTAAVERLATAHVSV